MQRWFFLEDPSFDKKRRKRIKPTKDIKMVSSQDLGNEMIRNTRLWKFQVRAPNVKAPEVVCITGDIPELGGWKHDKVFPMKREYETDVWTANVIVPSDCDISFRFCVAVFPEDPKDVQIRRFEANIHPRTIRACDHPDMDAIETFGEYDSKKNVVSKWITSETVIQFKFFNNPLNLNKTRLVGRLYYIKVTPVKLSTNSEAVCADDSLNADTNDVPEPVPEARTEVCTLNNLRCSPVEQEQFGREYNADDFLLITVTVTKPESLAYLVDIYTYSSRSAPEHPPYHLGYAYVLPTMLKDSEGKLELPITCNVKHRPLGTVNVEYLIIKPMPNNLCDLSVSYTKHWDPSWQGLDVGHRGLGSSFKTKGGTAIRENTIASLKQAAASGADLLEFDVQLSKDMVPVVYHDFHICISMKRKKHIEYSEMLELPVKELSLEQLQKLKVYHLVEGREHEPRFFDEDLEEHQPFPTLAEVLQIIDPHVGFNVELKWTMELQDGSFELNNPFDMNIYVDKVLEVVLQHAADRRIVFSCFNPDICSMVRYKQNRYPVMFLTQGQTSRYPSYRDWRCNSIHAAVQYAIAADLLGIVAHTEDLLRDPTQIKLATNVGLVIFCWGDDNNNTDTIRMLKQLGLHAVIYDKLDQFSSKEIKESIFLVEARESQKELIRLAVEDNKDDVASTAREGAPCRGDAAQHSATNLLSSSTSRQDDDVPVRPFLNLGVRENLALSTATSLDSITSSSSKQTLKRSLNLPVEKLDNLKISVGPTASSLLGSAINCDACVDRNNSPVQSEESSETSLKKARSSTVVEGEA